MTSDNPGPRLPAHGDLRTMEALQYGYRFMNTLDFDSADLVETPISEMTDMALDWATAQAVAEPITVALWLRTQNGPIQCQMTTESRCDVMGDPQGWSPTSNHEQIGAIQIALGISVTTENGIQWRAWHFSNPSVDHISTNPRSAICKAAIARRFGETLAVPRQLQVPGECLQKAQNVRIRQAGIKPQGESQIAQFPTALVRSRRA